MSKKNKQEKNMSSRFLRGLKVFSYGKATVEAEENAKIASDEADEVATNNQEKIEKFKEKYSEVKNSDNDLNIKW